MSDKIIKDFEFHIPVDLVKGDDEEWVIQGIASTQDEDLQGEVVDQDGLDISLLKAGRGIFNHDHQKGPENVLGQIEDAEFLNIDGKKALFVKGYLFKHQDRAKAYYNILKSIKKGSTHRVHFSIEGKILQRGFSDPKTIAKARIDKVALTLDPVNPVTYCSLAKSLATINEELSHEVEKALFPKQQLSSAPVECEMTKQENASSIKWLLDELSKLQSVSWLANSEFDGNNELKDLLESDYSRIKKEIIKRVKEHGGLLKALSAGAGYSGAPEAMEGGSVLQTESLDSDVKQIGSSKKKKKKMLKSIVDEISKQYPEMDKVELTKKVIEQYKSKEKEGKNGN